MLKSFAVDANLTLVADWFCIFIHLTEVTGISFYTLSIFNGLLDHTGMYVCLGGPCQLVTVKLHGCHNENLSWSSLHDN